MIELPKRTNASFARIPDIGLLFLFFEAYASIACTIASIPVAAVVAAGNPNVRTGSNTAKSGRIIGEETPLFSSPSTVIIETGVTSEPVPAVVGIKHRGNRGPMAFATPHALSKSSPDPNTSADSFATSIEEPPPNPSTPVHAISFPNLIAFSSVCNEGSASTSSNIFTLAPCFSRFLNKSS